MFVWVSICISLHPTALKQMILFDPDGPQISYNINSTNFSKEQYVLSTECQISNNAHGNHQMHN